MNRVRRGAKPPQEALTDPLVPDRCLRVVVSASVNEALPGQWDLIQISDPSRKLSTRVGPERSRHNPATEGAAAYLAVR